MATPQRARLRMHKPKSSPEPPTSLAAKHAVTCRTVEGFANYTVAPRSGTSERAVLYLHGGSYISEISSQHWALIGTLVDAGVRVEVPIYGLAPHHTYREAYTFVTAVYQELLADVDAGSVAVAGDSAGAGIALGFTQGLQPAGLPRPDRLVLISPWLDLTLSNPEIPRLERHDPWLSRAGLLEAGSAWAGGDDPADFRLSPLNGPMAGLPPMSVYVGTRDILFPDVLKLRDLASAAGVSFHLTVAPGAFHVYVLAPVPEGRRAAADLVRTLSAA